MQTIKFNAAELYKTPSNLLVTYIYTPLAVTVDKNSFLFTKALDFFESIYDPVNVINYASLKGEPVLPLLAEFQVDAVELDSSILISTWWVYRNIKMSERLIKRSKSVDNESTFELLQQLKTIRPDIYRVCSSIAPRKFLKAMADIPQLDPH